MFFAYIMFDFQKVDIVKRHVHFLFAQFQIKNIYYQKKYPAIILIKIIAYLVTLSQFGLSYTSPDIVFLFFACLFHLLNLLNILLFLTIYPLV